MIRPASDPRKLADYYQQDFAPIHYKGLATRTRKSYDRGFELFLSFAAPEVLIADVGPAELDAFGSWLRVRKMSPHNVRRFRDVVLRVLYDADPARFKQYQHDHPGIRGEGELWRYFIEVYEPQALVGTSQSCRTQYRRSICRLSRAAGHAATFADLTDGNVAKVMSDIIAAGCSKMTANKARSQLVALWRFIHRRRIVDVWPEVRKLPAYTRAPRAWSQDEVARLFAAADGEQGLVGDIPAKLWWRALLLALFDTGARIGAMLRLTWDRCQLDPGSILLLAEHQKQRSDQAFNLHADTVAALIAIRWPGRQLVFPWPMCEGTLYNHMARILRRARLPDGAKDKFHRLRRTHATMLTDAIGLDAASLAMGHSDPRLTRDNYVDMTKVRHVSPCDVIARPQENANTNGRPALAKLLEEYRATTSWGALQFKHLTRLATAGGFVWLEEVTADRTRLAYVTLHNTRSLAQVKEAQVAFRAFVGWLGTAKGITSPSLKEAAEIELVEGGAA